MSSAKSLGLEQFVKTLDQTWIYNPNFLSFLRGIYSSVYFRLFIAEIQIIASDERAEYKLQDDGTLVVQIWQAARYRREHQYSFGALPKLLAGLPPIPTLSAYAGIFPNLCYSLFVREASFNSALFQILSTIKLLCAQHEIPLAESFLRITETAELYDEWAEMDIAQDSQAKLANLYQI